jgi:hypothetical protein
VYTRRQFLQLAGIAVVSSQIPPSARWIESLIQDTAAMQGRALTPQTVFSQPSLSTSFVDQLWPDSVTSILAVHGDWYRLPQGFVPRTSLQPMKPFHPEPQPENVTLPFWAEVTGPAASIRQHCAANAPLMTRIGHGGVALVMDFLPDTPSPWYGVASDDGTLLGWTQAVHWQRVDENTLPDSGVTLELDSHKQQLTAWENGRVVLQAPCSIGREVQPGTYPVHERRIGGTRVYLDDDLEVYGVPWRTTFGDYELSGAYWHNRFGSPIAGASVQVTPLLAQWLYASLNQDISRVTVI